VAAFTRGPRGGECTSNVSESAAGYWSFRTSPPVQKIDCYPQVDALTSSRRHDREPVGNSSAILPIRSPVVASRRDPIQDLVNGVSVGRVDDGKWSTGPTAGTMPQASTGNPIAARFRPGGKMTGSRSIVVPDGSGRLQVVRFERRSTRTSITGADHSHHGG
jgi:hypothetical protein